MKKILMISIGFIFILCSTVFAENSESEEKQLRNQHRKQLRNEIKSENTNCNSDTKRVKHSYRTAKRINQGNSNNK